MTAFTTSAAPKYRSLSLLLVTLEPMLDAGLIALDPRWRDNEQALGIMLPRDPGLGAFVFTYGQPAGRYAVELAYPEAGDAITSGEPLIREELSQARLLGLLRTHFGLPEPA